MPRHPATPGDLFRNPRYRPILEFLERGEDGASFREIREAMEPVFGPDPEFPRQELFKRLMRMERSGIVRRTRSPRKGGDRWNVVQDALHLATHETHLAWIRALGTAGGQRRPWSLGDDLDVVLHGLPADIPEGPEDLRFYDALRRLKEAARDLADSLYQGENRYTEARRRLTNLQERWSKIYWDTRRKHGIPVPDVQDPIEDHASYVDWMFVNMDEYRRGSVAAWRDLRRNEVVQKIEAEEKECFEELRKWVFVVSIMSPFDVGLPNLLPWGP